MKVLWWKLGLIRMIGLVVLVIGLDGIATNIYLHQWWDIKEMSMPSALCLVLIAVALFVIGYKGEVASYEETDELAGARGHHRSRAGD